MYDLSPHDTVADRVVGFVQRLHDLLPLSTRRRQLPGELGRVHRALLLSLVQRGRGLTLDEVARMVAIPAPAQVLARLSHDDLIVLDAESGAAVGAYPVTLEKTPHRLTIAGRTLHAMCALDALAVAPLFGEAVRIDSRCHVSGVAVQLQQAGMRITQARPSGAVHVGIRWQAPGACAAHSLCREMVFLQDEATAYAWRAPDVANRSVLALDEAVAVGYEFFRPLLAS